MKKVNPAAAFKPPKRTSEGDLAMVTGGAGASPAPKPTDFYQPNPTGIEEN